MCPDFQGGNTGSNPVGGAQRAPDQRRARDVVNTIVPALPIKLPIKSTSGHDRCAWRT